MLYQRASGSTWLISDPLRRYKQVQIRHLYGGSIKLILMRVDNFFCVTFLVMDIFILPPCESFRWRYDQGRENLKYELEGMISSMNQGWSAPHAVFVTVLTSIVD